MLNINAYRSAKFQATTRYFTDRIFCQAPPDELTDWDKTSTPMLSFPAYNDKEERYVWMAVPVDFIISIEEV